MDSNNMTWREHRVPKALTATPFHECPEGHSAGWAFLLGWLEQRKHSWYRTKGKRGNVRGEMTRVRATEGERVLRWVPAHSRVNSWWAAFECRGSGVLQVYTAGLYTASRDHRRLWACVFSVHCQETGFKKYLNASLGQNKLIFIMA